MAGTEPDATLDEIRAIVREMPGPDMEAASAALSAAGRLAAVPMLGALADLAAWLGAWQGQKPAHVARPRVSIFVGAHGMAPDAAADAVARVQACVDGAAAVNRLCRLADTDLRVYELALDRPTGAADAGDAMDEEDCARAMAYGMMAVETGVDLMALAALPSGGNASSAALLAAAAGGTAADWLEPGDPAAARAEAALARHREAATDPFDLLRRLGGHETAAIAGAIMAARLARVPVLLEGPEAFAAAAVVRAAYARGLDHCRAAGTPDAARRLGIETVAAPAAGREPGLALGLAVATLKAAAELVQPD